MSRLALGILLLIVIGCGGDSTGPSPDSEPSRNAGTGRAQDATVPAEVRQRVAPQIDRMMQAFLDNDPSVLESLLVEEARSQPDAVAGLFDQIRQRLSSGSLEPFAELYARFEPGASDPATVETDGADPLRVTLTPAGSEGVVILQQIRGGFQDGLLVSVWILRDGEWALASMRMGTLRVGGRSAMDWYREAIGLADRGLALPAALRLKVGVDLLRPVSFIEYADAEDVRDRHRELQSAVARTQPFPVELDQLPQHPQVLGIEPRFVQGNLAPAVRYVTRLALADSSLGVEAQAITDHLAGLFDGFCYQTDSVAVAAYAEEPRDPNRRYEAIGLVATCSEPQS